MSTDGVATGAAVRESGLREEARQGAPGWGRFARCVAGPAMIVGGVLVLLRGFAFGGLSSTQHPDLLAFWLPNWCFLGRSIAAGHVPAWNPYSMGGLPFAADPQSGWMYLPAMALFSIVSCGRALGLMVALQPALGGVALYAFLRVEGLSRPAATVGGAMLALSLAQSRLALFLPFPSAMAWTAVTLAACARYLRAATAGRRFGWGLMAGVAWTQLVAAHAGHGAVIGTAIVVAYVAATVVSFVRRGAWTRRGAAATSLFLVPLFGLLDLAWLLPRLAYLPETSYGPGYANVPQLTSMPAAWPLKLATVPGAHLGATGLLLAPVALWSRRHRPLAVAFVAVGALGYVAALHPVVRALGTALRPVPVLSFYRHYPGRFAMALPFVLPILAAAGVDVWFGERARDGPRRWWLLAPGAVVWLALPFALGAPVLSMALMVPGAIVAVGVLAVVGLRPGIRAAAVTALLGAELIVAGLIGQSPAAFGFPVHTRDPFGALAIGWYTPLQRPDVRTASYVRPDRMTRAVSARTTGGRRFMTFAPDLLSSSGYLGGLSAAHWPSMANQRGMLFAAPDAQGYNPFQLERYWSLVQSIDRPRLQYNAAAFTRLSPSALDVLAVTTLIGPSGRPPEPGARAIATEGSWSAYSRATAIPFARGFTSWRTVRSPAEALRAVASRRFDPERELVIEGSRARSRTGQATVSVRWRLGGPQDISIDVVAASRAMVLVRIPYERFWTASLDGRSTPVLPADEVVQAVETPAGRHHVELRYDDPWIGRGVGAAGAAAAALVVAALWLGRRPVAQPPPEDGTPLKPSS